MMRSLYTASTGMYAQQLNVDTLAHNISNVNTTGFKKQRVEFQDLLYQQIKRPVVTSTTNEPVGLSIGLGVKPSATQTSFSQGNLQASNNALDVAISGLAFFKLEGGNDTEMYTRDGAIKIDAEGNLCTADGYKYVGAGPIDTEAYDVQIAADGTVTYMTPGDDAPQEAGKLELVKFANPAGLQALGGNRYIATPSSGEPEDWDSENDNTVSIQSGYLEMSNVQIVEEMVGLITAQRAYEMNSKVIQSSDEMLQTATSLRR